MLCKLRQVLPQLILTALGSVLFYHSAQLTLGSLRSPGPGMFPMAVSLALIFFSLIDLLKSSSKIVSSYVNARAASMTIVSLVVFAVFLESLGLVPAVIGCVVASRFAISDHSWTSTALLAIAVTGFVVIVFIYILKVPIGLW